MERELCIVHKPTSSCVYIFLYMLHNSCSVPYYYYYYYLHLIPPFCFSFFRQVLSSVHSVIGPALLNLHVSQLN